MNYHQKEAAKWKQAIKAQVRKCSFNPGMWYIQLHGMYKVQTLKTQDNRNKLFTTYEAAWDYIKLNRKDLTPPK